jgi:myosin heavy subunit
MNVLALIDEDSNLGGRTDAELVNKMATTHRHNDLFKISALSEQRTGFAIQHFAGG